jgi:HAD superfamily hydrolase (TIGR01549 family)
MLYDAVIFDNDGVLIEPTDRDIVVDAIRDVLRQYGITDPSTAELETLYSPTVEDVKTICSHYDIDPDDFWRDRENAASQAHQYAVTQGNKQSYPDVSALDELEPVLALVSNNQQMTIDHYLDAYSLRDHFAVAYGREPTLKGLTRKKPNPYYIKQALEEIGSNKPLYVGDSNSDIVAAHALGIDVVFLRRAHRKEYELESTPTYEITTLAELPSLLRSSN